MDAKIIINCPDVSKEEVRLMLQAVRDCEQQHLLDKRLFVWIDTRPELTMEESKDLLASIRPPWSFHKKV